MADTNWTNEELASIDRIPRYNILDPAAGGDAYSFGGDGYLDNQMRQTVDALIVARGVRRMALSASSAAILAAQEAASAKAERMAAQNAATNAYNSAQDAAAKVALAAAEADRAKAQADIAKGYATGLKLPAVTPDMAGRFLKVNADGTAYELGLITIATAAEINAGTGTGLANAATLGPILQGIRDATDAASLASAPIGSYVLRMYGAPSPGPNWLEAKGQIVSLASYPGLATALPPTIKQLGSFNPAGPSVAAVQPSSGVDAQSRIYQGFFEGTRFACLQQSYVRFDDPATGKAFEKVLSVNATEMDGQYSIPPVIRDSNEIVYIMGGASQVAHIDLNTQAGLDAGVRSSNTGTEAAAQHNYEGLYKLPNGTLIFISLNLNASTNVQYQNIWKLPPGSGPTGWQGFLPISGGASTVMPQNFPHFQTKSGHVYALLSASGKNGPTWNVYRTLDGTSWQNVGSVTLDRAGFPWVAGGKRREVSYRLFSVKEESPDGQDIIVTLANYGFLISSNGGNSWTFKTAEALLGLTALGFSDPGTETWRVGFSWDSIGSQWLFSYGGRKGSSNSQLYLLVSSGARLTTVTKQAEVTVNNQTQNLDGSVCFVYRTQGFIHIFYGIQGGQQRVRISATQTGNLTTAASSLPGTQILYLVGILFDGLVMLAGSNSSVTTWLFNDDSEVITASDNGSNFTVRGWTFSASSDGLRMSIMGSYPAASQNYLWKSTAYDYNPATERKLPNTYFQQPNGTPLVREEYRQAASQPKFFMRVK